MNFTDMYLCRAQSGKHTWFKGGEPFWDQDSKSWRAATLWSPAAIIPSLLIEAEFPLLAMEPGEGYPLIVETLTISAEGVDEKYSYHVIRLDRDNPIQQMEKDSGDTQEPE